MTVHKGKTISAFAITMLLTTGCGGGSPHLAGLWVADDGSGSKTITEDGRCSGMFYHQGQPLDIGGGMRCTLGEVADDNGRYALQVDQPPNQQTLRLDFIDDDEVEVYEGDQLIFTMTRQ
jgi:hypothetical protein